MDLPSLLRLGPEPQDGGCVVLLPGPDAPHPMTYSDALRESGVLAEGADTGRLLMPDPGGRTPMLPNDYPWLYEQATAHRPVLLIVDETAMLDQKTGLALLGAIARELDIPVAVIGAPTYPGLDEADAKTAAWVLRMVRKAGPDGIAYGEITDRVKLAHVARKALRYLVERGFIHETKVPTNGRPKTVYSLAPLSTPVGRIEPSGAA